MALFRYGTQVCGSIEAGSQREWLVTDGCGGYAMGTVAGLRTRRYHGLLVVGGRDEAGRASGQVPGRRFMALAALDPVITLSSGTEVRLATHEWSSGALQPRGHELLQSFELRDGLPSWRWRVGEVVLQRRLAFRHGTPSLAVTHTLLAGGPVRLAVEPLCTWRDVHGERHARDGLRVVPDSRGVSVEDAYRIAGPGFHPDGHWYLGVHHREEQARGLAPGEDLFRPGAFRADLDTGQTLSINAWAGPAAQLVAQPPPAREVIDAARQRHRELAGTGDEITGALRLAADAFIVGPGSAGTGSNSTGSNSTGSNGTGSKGTGSASIISGAGSLAGVQVVAGYPWFGAWSRDTMISYEGLFLRTGRAEQGRELLRGYAGMLSAGMLPNTSDATDPANPGGPAHNTADATLWLLHAVDRHVEATRDTDLAAALIGALDSVVSHHVRGTRFHLRVDPADGLLSQGLPGYALTWMDAVIDGVPVTPRAGKAVELNALWINCLAALARLRGRLGRPTHDLDRLHAKATASFRRRFPARVGWLTDVVDAPTGDDSALRPNQLFAYSLPYAPMRGTDPAPLRWVGARLLTPLGIRTLAPEHQDYHGRHRGEQAARDRAYHQGTVWPWLIGAYADALAAVGATVPDGLTDGLLAHLGEWGVGSVSETADGDPPHAATGCPFQAWSVAELLRVLHPKDTP